MRRPAHEATGCNISRSCSTDGRLRPRSGAGGSSWTAAWTNVATKVGKNVPYQGRARLAGRPTPVLERCGNTDVRFVERFALRDPRSGAVIERALIEARDPTIGAQAEPAANRRGGGVAAGWADRLPWKGAK